MDRIIMDTVWGGPSVSQKEDRIIERHSLSSDGILHQVNFTPVSVSLNYQTLFSSLFTANPLLCALRKLFVDGGIPTYTEVLTPEFLIDKGSDSSAPCTASYPLFLLSLAQL